MRILLAILVMVSAVMGIGSQAILAAELIGPVATGPGSEIFSPAVLPGSDEARALTAAGYVQEEYFLRGTARVYGRDAQDQLITERRNVPYTTRLMIIRPLDPKRFSGTIQLGMFHPNLAGNGWSRIGPLVLRSGAIYAVIGIGTDEFSRNASKPDAPMTATEAPKWFEPERYAPLNWPEEDGIRWDVFSQTATILKSGHVPKPLKPYRLDRLYASGWSFLGSFLRTYINEGFHDRAHMPGQRPAIDGYLIGISSSSQLPGFLPVNSHSANRPLDDPKRVLKPVDVPIIELLSENEAVANTGPQAKDSDQSAGGHRLYELAGVSHGDTGYTQTRTNAVQLAAKGHPAFARPQPACPVAETDVPMRDIAQAAHVNLDIWSRYGAAPPKSARLQLNADGTPVTDPQGNIAGGVRVAQLDVPLARYGKPPGGVCGGPDARYRIIRRNPLPEAELRRLYPGGADDYLMQFAARLQKLTAEGWILPDDAAIELAAAKAASKTAIFVARDQKAD